MDDYRCFGSKKAFAGSSSSDSGAGGDFAVMDLQVPAISQADKVVIKYNLSFQ